MRQEANQGVPPVAEAAARHWPYASLLLAAMAVAIHRLSGAAELLELGRAAMFDGEVWRLITCHLTHFGTDHLLWDVAVLVVLGAICERWDRPRMLVAMLLAGLLIPLGVLWLLPEITHYRGLSGIDSALFGLLAGMLMVENRRRRNRVGLILAGGLVAAFVLKLAVEMMLDVTIFADSHTGGYVPVPLAHGIGLMAGLAVALWRSEWWARCHSTGRREPIQPVG